MESNQHVKADRHQFEPDERRDQVHAGCKEIHTALRQQNEPAEFGKRFSRIFEELVGDQQDERRRCSEDSVEEQAKTVHYDRSLKTSEMADTLIRECRILLPKRTRREGEPDESDAQEPLFSHLG